MIDKLLKSKYDATHLEICTNNQHEILEKLLNKAARHVIGFIPGFLTEAINRPTKEMGLGYAPMTN